jgi:hypothetical protein
VRGISQVFDFPTDDAANAMHIICKVPENLTAVTEDFATSPRVKLNSGFFHKEHKNFLMYAFHICPTVTSLAKANGALPLANKQSLSLLRQNLLIKLDI